MTRLRARLRALPTGMGRALRVAGILVVGLLAFGLAFGLPLSLLADTDVAVVAVVVVVSVLPGTELAWPTPREESVSHGWSHVSMLAHGIAVADSSPWEFDAVVRPRLRRLAEAALARRGVDWAGDEAATLLGADVHAALSAPPANRVTARGLLEASDRGGPPAPTGTRTSLAQATLDALDRLEPVVRHANADQPEPADILSLPR